MEQTPPSTATSTATSTAAAIATTPSSLATATLLDGEKNVFDISTDHTDRGNDCSSVNEHGGTTYCCLRWRIKSVVTFLSSAFLILLLGGVVLGFIDIETLEKLQPLLRIIAQTSVGENSTLLIEDGEF